MLYWFLILVSWSWRRASLISGIVDADAMALNRTWVGNGGPDGWLYSCKWPTVPTYFSLGPETTKRRNLHYQVMIISIKHQAAVEGELKVFHE